MFGINVGTILFIMSTHFARCDAKDERRVYSTLLLILCLFLILSMCVLMDVTNFDVLLRGKLS